MRLLLLLPFLAPAAAPGVVLFDDQFNSATIDPAWRVVRGEWKLAGGGLKGVEDPQNKLPALISRPAAFQDGVIQTRFKLEGAFLAAILIEDANGHLCRVLAGPKGIRIVKDGNRKTNEKSILLAESRAPVATGEWQVLTVTIEGIRIRANLGSVTLSGRHSSISAPKTSVGLPVFGNSASFDWIRVSKLR
jgi:hypothetical protein